MDPLTSNFAYLIGQTRIRTNALSISYCKILSKFVLKTWVNRKWVCLEESDSLKERQDIINFLQNKAKFIYVRGKDFSYVFLISEFRRDIYGNLIHPRKKITINLFDNINQSYRDVNFNREYFEDIIIV